MPDCSPPSVVVLVPSFPPCPFCTFVELLDLVCTLCVAGKNDFVLCVVVLYAGVAVSVSHQCILVAMSFFGCGGKGGGRFCASFWCPFPILPVFAVLSLPSEDGVSDDVPPFWESLGGSPQDVTSAESAGEDSAFEQQESSKLFR